ncbi:MAG: gamma-glutamylcyclotransferase [Burkholderiaceae bacterium]|nr:gamma-glutamylcyclotransferase [Burkholderiaceae bacterium]
MSSEPTKPRSHVITRERLLDGSLAEAFRANAPPGYMVRSQAELDESLAQTLAGRSHDRDVHVFGYGSLMWNPAIEHVEAVKAHVYGWSRRYCIRLVMGRGSSERPGLMLALDRGGSCYGLAFRIPADRAAEELRLLWRREMLSGAYQARWVGATIHGRREQVLTFVVNRTSPRYMGQLPMPQLVHMLRTGAGNLGTCREYFDSTMASLHKLGVRDAGLERVRHALETLPGANVV